MDLKDTALLPPLLLIFNTMFPLILPTTALNWCLFLVAIDLARYFFYASWDLQYALGLNIFSLLYPPGHPGPATTPVASISMT
jgi:hypothetical protein